MRPEPIRPPSHAFKGPTSPSLAERRMSNSPRTLSPRLAAAQEQELSAFTQLCRSAYFEKDPTALALVDQTVRNQPLGIRSAYIKAQSAVRVDFHANVERERAEHLTRALSHTDSGSTIAAIVGWSTEAMRSSHARKERSRRLMQFLSSHALRSMIGVHPFLRSLYAAMQIQYRPVAQGGAGKRLVEWDVDEAVFMESAGADFLKDSIELLKGVLGMDERVKDANPVSWAAGSDSESEEDEPVSPPALASPEKVLISIEQPQLVGLRGRSPSDPFIDPVEPTSPTPHLQRPAKPSRRPSAQALPPVIRIRTFTFPPYLTNPELEDLSALFPPWIRTTSPPSKALEEGTAVGHGTLRIGQRPRDDGFEGRTLERFVHWLLRVLHLA